LQARLQLDVKYSARRPWAPAVRELRTWTLAALNGRSESFALDVHVVGSLRSRGLNARYRGKDRPTNVLSFAGAGTSPQGCRHIGELVICAPVVAREAREQGKSLAQHWAHMTVHGVLHLLGFDHERAAEARKMVASEVQILDRLGFSDPYL
jgi:probable rRNA maturation factor